MLGLLGAPALTAQSLPLAGIAHVAFRVSNLEQSRAFYQKLGFEQFLEFSANGKTTVSYMKVNDRQFIELYPRSEDSQSLGLMHVCYESDEIVRVHDAYAARGLNPTEVKKAHAGNLLFVIHDPEGPLLEYTQYEPGSLHSVDRGKHLGAHRISQELIGAYVPVQDLAAEDAYYTQKLGFVAQGAANVLRVPGASDDAIHLEPADGKPGITFEVNSAKRAAKELRHRGIAVEVQPDSVSVNDPDGAVIVFQQAGKR